MISSMNVHQVVSIVHTTKLVTDVTTDPYVVHRLTIQTRDGSEFDLAVFTTDLNLAIESQPEQTAPIPETTLATDYESAES